MATLSSMTTRHRYAGFALLAALVASQAGGAVDATLSEPHNYRDKNFDYFVVGDPTLPRAAHTEFALARMGGGISAETIVFHHREASFDPRVIAALRAADGIFLAGVDQGNYIRYWKGTPVQEALNAHVLADRPIGGSSAGLALHSVAPG